MQFRKLRLQGFKSFVEPSEVLIQSGLTGIVGPNGCGKSNIVEALRWVMGETSAKRLRGGEMDDVIFSGSRNRPPRNNANVVLTLDNSDHSAPSTFNDQTELEIVRQIDRGEGSAFKINGRDVRAKDVQLLFADMATGSQATAIVRQGQIGALINAKPQERRALLEEAAGIRGLYTRRHEADLKLAGTEANLQRLDDILSQKESIRKSLKSQARQASRYKSLSDRLRRAESLLTVLQHIHLNAENEKHKAVLKELEEKLEAVIRESAGESKIEAELAAELPALRKAEAEASAQLQRYQIELANLKIEEQRIEGELAEVRQQLTQIDEDRQREQSIASEATKTVAKLDEELKELQAHKESEEAALILQEALEKSKAKVAEVEAKASQLTADLANAEAQKTSLQNQQAAFKERLEKFATLKTDLEKELQDIQAQLESDADLQAAKANIEQAEKSWTDQQQKLDAAEQAVQAAQAVAELANQTWRDLQAQLSKAVAEQEGLEKLLQDTKEDDYPPIIDKVDVNPGFEAALAAAIGDELNAAMDAAARRHWLDLGQLNQSQALPSGAKPLTDVIQAPAALQRLLSQVGIVENDADGSTLQASLAPGQCLVSQSGHLWRWDGFVQKSAADSNATALRLQQQNRLQQLQEQNQRLEKDVAGAGEQKQQAEEKLTVAQNNLRETRTTLNEALNAVEAARQQVRVVEQNQQTTIQRQANIKDRLQHLESDRADIESQMQDGAERLENLADTSAMAAKLEEAKQELSRERTEHMGHQNRFDNHAREVEQRKNRIQTIQQEMENWQSRQQTASNRQGILDTRQQEATAKQQDLQEKPQALEAKRFQLADMVEKAEQAKLDKVKALQDKEQAASDVAQRLKNQQQTISGYKEQRATVAADVNHNQEKITQLLQTMHEKFESTPDQLAEQFNEDELADTTITAAGDTVGRLLRERDNMGPVNLRADVELEELAGELLKIEEEKENLVEAIGKLRTAIQTLNREGRQRLLTAFEEVNANFSQLFERLFEGGKAHLALTESDDPLQAGLEVMAQPPGKRLQSLSLLSGGEQALTTVALIFSVFLTNPAPICVLDEVDAPLDDANVSRFCRLLEDMASKTDTSFVIITHHRMTMARMDRLYGVTMPEEGISQLVSVDLQTMADLRRTA